MVRVHTVTAGRSGKNKMSQLPRQTEQSFKAVILDGSPGTTLQQLANYCSKLEYPFASVPGISYNLVSLKNYNIKEVAVISSERLRLNEDIKNSFKGFTGNNIQVSYIEEKKPQGTAGSLKKIESFIGSSNFLVMSSDLFLEDLDLNQIIYFHLKNRSVATVVVEERCGNGNEVGGDLENFIVGSDGLIKGFRNLHYSKNRRCCMKPSGLYVFSPKVFSFIKESNYMDIKEQLITSLGNNGIPVRAYVQKKPVRKFCSLSDYFELNKDILFNGMGKLDVISNSRTQIGEGIWVGKNVKISPKAYLLGPIAIGDNCTIGDHAQIIGPTSISSETKIAKNVLVRESIIWEKVHIQDNARIEYSLIGESCTVAKGKSLRNAVVIEEKKFSDNVDIFTSQGGKNKKSDTNGNISFLPTSEKQSVFKINSLLKRAMDITFSSLALILSVPLFIIIAAAIKLDSSGPVFFSQRRCGREGKEFKMYKFRTMVLNADRLQKQFKDKNNVGDGPMFKIKKDPRMTTVGRLLRKVSLDEVPQFFNVLNGSMSLVGPRPLVMDEMNYCPGWRDIRLKVRPGITGLWQIHSRGKGGFTDWIKYDIDYVRKCSLWFDIKILFKTIRVVLHGT